MKKVFLMLVMLFTMSVYSFAENTSATMINDVEKYSLKVNVKKLSAFLQLDSIQMGDVELVEEEFKNDLMFVATECNDNNRNAVMKNALNKHIKQMYYVLDDKQYYKYLKVLNATIRNRGLI